MLTSNFENKEDRYNTIDVLLQRNFFSDLHLAVSNLHIETQTQINSFSPLYQKQEKLKLINKILQNLLEYSVNSVNMQGTHIGMQKNNSRGTFCVLMIDQFDFMTFLSLLYSFLFMFDSESKTIHYLDLLEQLDILCTRFHVPLDLNSKSFSHFHLEKNINHRIRKFI